MRKIVLIGIPTGAILGVVAGLVGIGGGICSLPCSFLRGWLIQNAAATSSVFIVANSVSGFLDNR